MRRLRPLLPLTLAAAIAPMATGAPAPRRRPLPPNYQSSKSISDPVETNASLDITYASVGQVGPNLVAAVRTRGKWRPRDLGNGKRSLCLHVWRNPQATGRGEKVCAGRVHGRAGVRLGSRALDARVSQRGGRSLTISVDPAELGISVGSRFGWRFESGWPKHSDRAPDGNPEQGSIVAVHPLGCEAGNPSYITSGPRDRPDVALTFDDGPSPYTAAVLSQLERLHVAASFMLVGEHIARHEQDLRREVKDGDVLGDHTWDHANVASDGPKAEQEIVSTEQAIEKAAGFTPCLFRAPYGATSPALIGEARRLGFDTLQWDVDPRDWSTPGTDAIVRRVTGAVHPGAIILLHDGGGPRDQTVAAIPQIVAALRARGYRFDTVPALLGLRTAYQR